MLISSAVGCSNVPENAVQTSKITASSASAESYAKWLDEKLGDRSFGDIIICDAADSVKYDIDLSDFQSGGYTIRKSGTSTVIAAKDDAGLDAAVRYFAKYATIADMNVTEGEGYRVKSINIDGHDLSEYTVYVPTEIPENAVAENLTYAADVLIEKVKEACGVTLKKTGIMDGRQIIFAYDGETYGPEAFNISIDNGNVTITAGTKRGPLYGAYGFLEECIGYRFLTRGEVYLYEAEEIALENGYSHTEGTETPFEWRDTYTDIDGKGHLYPAPALNSKYIESNVALHNVGTWTHGWLRQAKYGYGEGPDRNHSSYALIPSVPDLETPCFSDPDVFDECLENMRKHINNLEAQGFKWGVNMPQLSISQNDTGAWCNCSDCLKLIGKYKAYSSTLIDFISRISDELISEYPEIQFWMLAYLGSTTKPPVGMEIPENLTICYCHYLVCNNHDVTGEICGGYKEEIYNYYKSWTELTENVHVWYYANAFTYSLTPAPNIYQFKEDILHFAETGAKGFFFQNEETTLGFDDLSSYLAAELLWNPYMTDEEYQAKIDEFCYIFYGDGYELISEYVKELNKAGDLNECWSALTDAPFAVYNYDYLAANFDSFIELFETAIKMANTSTQEARLKRLSCHMYFNCIAAQFDDTMANGTDEEKAVLTERYQLLYDRLYEIKDTTMFGIFTNDKLPEVFNPNEHPFNWLTKKSSTWGDMME